jgi:Phage protein Gp138 N-terminal domain
MPRRRSLTLEEILDLVAFNAAAAHYKIQPGIVQKYYAGTGTSPARIDVQPAVNDVRFDPVLGTPVWEPWPVCPQVPVVRLEMGGFAVKAPLKAGDECVLFGFDLDPTPFRVSGQQSNPLDTRRHGGGYWVALPLRLSDPGQTADPDGNMFVGVPGGVGVEVSTSSVNLGAAGAATALALCTKIDSLITLLTTPYAASGTETGFALLQTALSTWKTANWTASATTGATKVNGV